MSTDAPICDTPAAPEPDDGIRFINEYLYENDLITDFARLQASGARRAAVLVFGAISLVFGIVWLLSPQSLNWLGIVFVCIGAYLLWYWKNMHHVMARNFIDAVESDPTFGGRWRRVAATDEGLMVFGRSGQSRYYAFDELTGVLANDRIIVAAFNTSGVTVPRDTFARGTDTEFEAFLQEKLRR